ncbi:TIGR01841 family phasin [Massilia sp. RP-1-19]|uniref:TIGR01841 family phasin n=1 Tax=Massilia polaris TaxID=2728846 RepID=A0A848HHV7_9BURK|nr:phasin family protein [Massilia polaris]NML59641.1 TIGR01841 family phasin [Massilia polaris]
MFPFSQSVTPAVRSHLEAQMAFMNDMSKSLFRSFQQLCDLNIQLTQTMLEESALASNSMLTADRQTEVFSAAASRAQPATEKLRAYQQHISRVAADSQVELARVAEQHVQETTRTAHALADEVARVATDETDRNMRSQQETMRKFSDPFHTGDGQMRGDGGAQRAGASMQSSSPGSAQGSSGGAGQGDLQGNIPVQGGQSQASKGSATSGARRE